MARHYLILVGSLVLASAIWLSSVHQLFVSGKGDIFSTSGIPQKAKAMAAAQTHMWRDPILREQALHTMRRSNAEWDFMGRTFLVLALGEMCLREPSLNRDYLPLMDTIIHETIRLDHEQGMYFFLLPYAKAKPFVAQPSRSLFIDSEIALMISARQMVEEKSTYKQELADRIDAIVDRWQKSPNQVLESYPNECWLFDHSMAIAAIRVSDYLDGRDHSPWLRQWLKQARLDLADKKTGLMISSFTETRKRLDGPEGSSIWLAAHCLRLIDEDFAKEQYSLAHKYLARNLCGFAWSREWPATEKSALDIDSGLVIPILEVSPGGSGLAFIGAASFGDHEFLRQLHTTLDFAAFPDKSADQLRYCASNPLGDAVMLYSLVLGPMWNRVMKGTK